MAASILVGFLIGASTGGSASVTAGAPWLEKLVARIPEVAHDEHVLDAEEDRLADEILAQGAPAMPLLRYPSSPSRGPARPGCRTASSPFALSAASGRLRPASSLRCWPSQEEIPVTSSRSWKMPS